MKFKCSVTLALWFALCSAHSRFLAGSEKQCMLIMRTAVVDAVLPC